VRCASVAFPPTTILNAASFHCTRRGAIVLSAVNNGSPYEPPIDMPSRAIANGRTHATIFSLSDKVILRIMKAVVDGDDLNEATIFMPVSRVNKKWHHIAQSNASLWANIQLDLSHPYWDRGDIHMALKKYISLSFPHLLAITLRDSGMTLPMRQHSVVLDLITATSARWRSLCLMLRIEHFSLPSFAGISTLPELRVLRVGKSLAKEKPVVVLLPRWLFRGTSKLQNITLSDNFLPLVHSYWYSVFPEATWEQYNLTPHWRSITDLTLSAMDFLVLYNELIASEAFTVSFASLERLCILSPLYCTPFKASSRPLIHFPSLKTLEFNSVDLDSRAPREDVDSPLAIFNNLLGTIKAPKLESLKIRDRTQGSQIRVHDMHIISLIKNSNASLHHLEIGLGTEESMACSSTTRYLHDKAGFLAHMQGLKTIKFYVCSGIGLSELIERDIILNFLFAIRTNLPSLEAITIQCRCALSADVFHYLLDLLEAQADSMRKASLQWISPTPFTQSRLFKKTQSIIGPVDSELLKSRLLDMEKDGTKVHTECYRVPHHDSGKYTVSTTIERRLV